MHYVEQIGKKFNRIRKQNWSAPTIMAVFILSCMLIIFSLESLGLANKEKNLDYRINTPEKIIKAVSNDIGSKNNHSCQAIPSACDYDSSNLRENYSFDNSKLKLFTAKNREEHLLEIQMILIEGAKYQFLYENNFTENDSYFNSEDLFSFFDI